MQTKLGHKILQTRNQIEKYCKENNKYEVEIGNSKDQLENSSINFKTVQESKITVDVCFRDLIPKIQLKSE